MNIIPGASASPVYTQIVPTIYTNVAGVAGYIDTDCSASLPANSKIAVVWMLGASQAGGVRPVGSAVAVEFVVPNGALVTVLSVIPANRHLDLYRQPANNNSYYIIGFYS